MRYRGNDGVSVSVRLLALGGAGATVLGLAAVALAAHYEGTGGDDSITAEQGSSTAYLRGGNDTFFGAPGATGGADHVWAGSGNDDITGRTFGDLLRGGGGSDTLDGGADPDELRGGPGDDRLIGGGGRDLFRPGAGEDTCVGQLRDFGFLPSNCEHSQVTGG